MFQLAAVFSPGFEKVIPQVLMDVMEDAKNINVSSGFVRFCVDKNPFRAINADFFNNSFLVLKEWNASSAASTKAPKFEVMANKIKIPENLIPEILNQHYKTFRLRFSASNVFTSVNKQIMTNVEKQISVQIGLKPDRLGGDTEFWFLTRSDGYACFALRMTKKQSTEKYLEKGELRPEFVTLLAAFAGITKSSGVEATSHEFTILDPFAGHGGIVKRISAMLPNSTIFASEIDERLTNSLPNLKNVQKFQCNVENLSFLTDKSIDVIITDPPWGFFQGDLRDDEKLLCLYKSMLKEFSRVIKNDGTICILTAAKEIFEKAFDNSVFAKNFKIDKNISGKEIRNDVLVNGKKSAVYVWKS